LASCPPGDPPVHYGHHLAAVTASSSTYGLQDDATKGGKAVHLYVTRRVIQQVQLLPKLEEKGILATQGDRPKHGQGMLDDLPPDVVRHGVISKGRFNTSRAGISAVLLTRPVFTPFADISAGDKQAAGQANNFLSSFEPNGDRCRVRTLLQVYPLDVIDAGLLRGPGGARTTEGATPRCGAQSRGR
jgi:hypothetical protein